MIDGSALAAIASGVAGLIGGGGLVAWRKAGAEIESVAVATLRDVIAELRRELDYKEDEIKGLRGRVDRAEQRLDEVLSNPPPYLA